MNDSTKESIWKVRISHDTIALFSMYSSSLAIAIGYRLFQASLALGFHSRRHLPWHDP